MAHIQILAMPIWKFEFCEGSKLACGGPALAPDSTAPRFLLPAFLPAAKQSTANQIKQLKSHKVAALLWFPLQQPKTKKKGTFKKTDAPTSDFGWRKAPHAPARAARG